MLPACLTTRNEPNLLKAQRPAYVHSNVRGRPAGVPPAAQQFVMAWTNGHDTGPLLWRLQRQLMMQTDCTTYLRETVARHVLNLRHIGDPGTALTRIPHVWMNTHARQRVRTPLLVLPHTFPPHFHRCAPTNV